MYHYNQSRAAAYDNKTHGKEIRVKRHTHTVIKYIYSSCVLVVSYSAIIITVLIIPFIFFAFYTDIVMGLHASSEIKFKPGQKPV